MRPRISLTMLAVVLFSTVAAAQGRPMREHPGRMIEQLKLNEEQQKQFDALASDFRKAAVDQRAEIAKARIELQDLLKADNPDKGKISAQFEEISLMESRAKAKGLEHWFAVNSILNSEQQKLWRKGLIRFAEGPMALRRARADRARQREVERPAPAPR